MKLRLRPRVGSERPGRIRRLLWDSLGIVSGAAIVALALDVFLVPNRLAAGGIAGIATVFFHTAGFPVGVTMIVLNLGLLVAGVRVHGRTYGAKTILGTFSVAVLVDVLAPFVPTVTGDALLATAYGGIIAGLGMGIAFRFGGNTGGTDIIVQIAQKYSNMPIGRLYLMVDAMVMVIAASAFGVRLALYGMLAVFITGWVIDLVQEGTRTEKIAFIVTDNAQGIARRVMDELERGVTGLATAGMYTGTERTTLFCVVQRRQLETLKRIVVEEDPEAFCIIHDAGEVIGHGFKPLR